MEALTTSLRRSWWLQAPTCWSQDRRSSPQTRECKRQWSHYEQRQPRWPTDPGGSGIFFRRGALMQIGIIGLGRMGANMARRLVRNGHQCVVFDLSPKTVGELAKDGAV